MTVDKALALTRVVGGTAVPVGSPSLEGPAAANGPDALTIGRRLRHLRRRSASTLDQLAGRAGMSASALSLIENGKREAKLSVLQALAAALGVGLDELLDVRAPSRRAALEIELEQAQRSPAFPGLGVPAVRTGPRLPMEALEALVGLHQALARVTAERAATPEEARRANAALRRRMREADNYFPQLEAAAAELLAAVSHEGGAITRIDIDRMARHLGFDLVPAEDLPHSTRTVVDLANRRIYLPQPATGQSRSRTLALQAMAHIILGHRVPRNYADFLQQRVEINYFAAAVLIPERTAVESLQRAKAVKDIAIEDLRDGFAVSYEQAAHRFTNLATRHLDVTVHFLRTHESGVVYKAYENDGVRFPQDAAGSIEGQRVCRYWTARTVFNQPDPSAAYQQYTDTSSGTYWCTAAVEATVNGLFSVNVGVPYAQVKWMRGRDTTARSASRCPDPNCCATPDPELAERWAGRSWPSARVPTNLLTVLPPGVFPGVDDTEVHTFLDRHAP